MGGPSDGLYPWGNLTFDGTALYGMTQGGGGTNSNGIVFSYTLAVPEPSTLAILGAGVLCLFGYAWRRRRHSSNR